MRKSFFSKAIVAVGIMASAMALSSMVVFTATTYLTSNDTTTLSKNGLTNYSKVTIDDVVDANGNNGKKYTYAVNSASESDTLTGIVANKIAQGTGKLNVDSDSYIKFTTDGVTNVSITNSSKKCNELTLKKGSPSYADTDKFNTIASGNKAVSSSGLAAGTYYIGRSGGNCYVESLEITVYDITYNSGTLTVNSGSNGTTTITVDGEAKTSPVSLNGGEEVVLTATPDANYAAVVIDGNNNTISLTNNQYAFTADGDLTLNVSYQRVYSKINITDSVTWEGGSNYSDDSKVKPFGVLASNDYYFELTDGASIGDINISDSEKSNLITLGSGTNGKKGVSFTTGDLTDKTASLKLTFASGGVESRKLNLNDETIANTTATKFDFTTTEATLASNTTYVVNTGGSGIYLSKIEIVVKDESSVDIAVGTVDSTPTVIVDGDTIYAIVLISDSKATDDTIESISLAGQTTDVIAPALDLDGYTESDYGSADYYAGYNITLGESYSGESTAAGIQAALGNVSFVNYEA